LIRPLQAIFFGLEFPVPSIFIQFAQDPVDAPDLFVVRHEQRDPPVEYRNLDRVVGQDQF